MAARFEIRRLGPGRWLLHCRWCGTSEETSSWEGALGLVSGHERFWHRHLLLRAGQAPEPIHRLFREARRGLDVIPAVR